MNWQLSPHLAPLDWDALYQQFDWVRDMNGVPQDAIYHAEGDVAIHTRLVLEALENLTEFQQLPAQQQHILRAAALLHDVEKRSTTIVQPNGRIESPSHARKGEPTSRWLLYHDLPAPHIVREEVARLVRRHGIPLWAIERPDPLRAVIFTSLECDTHLLYLLAKADVLGRICHDQQNLLDRCEYFRELCLEVDCYGKPFAFADGYSRFTWARDESQWHGTQRFDDTHSEVIVLCGLPGTGKDTWIKRHLDPELPVVSLDALREELDLEAGNPSDNSRAFHAAKELAKTYLRKRQPFVWNSTNIVSSLRGQIINLLAEYGAKVRLFYLEVPWETMLAQNRNREARVPEQVLRRFARKVEPPRIWEAHQVDYVVKD
jgi:predicted kinase